MPFCKPDDHLNANNLRDTFRSTEGHKSDQLASSVGSVFKPTYNVDELFMTAL